MLKEINLMWFISFCDEHDIKNQIQLWFFVPGDLHVYVVCDVIQKPAMGCLSGQAGGCCEPWENSSEEQVNMSSKPSWGSAVHSLSHMFNFPM